MQDIKYNHDMRRYVSYFVLLIAIALAPLLFWGHGFGGHRQNIFADLLSVINIQKDASSSVMSGAFSENNSDPTSTITLAYALQQFQKQIQFLDDQTANLRSEIEIINLRSIFTRTLKRGDTGNDVEKLQELLMRFPDLNPSDSDISDAVTGFYGSLTKAEVAQFQLQSGLRETGIFDFNTKEKLYESLSVLARENTSTEFAPVDISTISGLNNPGDLKDQTSAGIKESIADLQNQISQLAADSTSTQASIEDLQNKISGITANIYNIQAGISAPSFSTEPNFGAAAMPISAPVQTSASASTLSSSAAQTSTPASTSSSSVASAKMPLLVISNVQIINISKTSSTITWVTNSSSTSEVDYSQNPAIPANQMFAISSADMATSHKLILLNLIANTKYYFRAISKDITGAVASSTVISFATLN